MIRMESLAARCWMRAGACAIGTLLLVLSPGRSQGQTQVALTKHNLSPSGVGTVKATESTGVCVFCHTPHNANPTLALWNRDLPATTYTPYSSSTLKAQPNQPTGSSRLCLSCHDGLLALGNLRRPGGPAITSLNTPLTGPTVLGTDLSGGHPISFVYDSALALSDPGLIDPALTPPGMHLDGAGQVQCTSCHNPHEDRQPNFLRADNRYSGICTSCHQPGLWKGSIHATSVATWNGTGTSPWLVGAYTTVSENGCESCHRSHASGHAPRLLAQSDEAGNCTVCHNGAVAQKDVATDFLKPSHHPVEISPWTHDPAETFATMPRHVACPDCHNPHAATAVAGAPPAVSGMLQAVPGMSISATALVSSANEFEVCNKCHGVTEPTTLGLARQGATRNIRLKIDPNNPSFHPIASAGKNPAVPDLQAGLTTSTIIGCTSCHDSDAWTATGSSPRGPHGSIYAPILAAQYNTSDPQVESYAVYALCYQCHNETSVTSDAAGTFHHRSHVITGQTPCAACHDAHGSRSNPHLIDFELRDGTGATVVTPSSGGQLSYTQTSTGHGQCYLTCHGVNHNPLSY